jgi:hypothetical protein
MAETTADVRRDIELTRERMSTTLQQLENKLNVKQVVRDNPWPALAIAVGAGVLLSRSHTDVKAAAATVAATRGASSKVGTVLDDVVANLVSGLHEAFESRITSIVNDLKSAIGAPVSRSGNGDTRATGVSVDQSTASPVVADRIDGMGRPVDPLGTMQPRRAD